MRDCRGGSEVSQKWMFVQTQGDVWKCEKEPRVLHLAESEINMGPLWQNISTTHF
jgi:hypothetical protein